ncbi:AIPR family protein [Lactococcus lactis]|jgi:hypothetical protein|uniref:AIPR family protein n=4 Tax=Lactococcus lactis TaxID=1358 RepID=UPI0015D4A275|nr:AIPR family protein [Lactococcus lactis]
MDNMLRILIGQGYIDNEDVKNKRKNIIDNFLYSIEHQTEDEVIDVYYSNFEKNILPQKIIDKIISETEKTESFNYRYYALFKNQNSERKYLNRLLENSNAAEKKEIKKLFGIITPIFTEQKETISLKINDEGINYLEYFSETENSNIEAKIYNISMLELQKLYNLTGDALFKRNVRIGIQNKKAGKELREEFKKYFLVGFYNSISSKDDQKQFKNEYQIQENTYTPSIFWYNHNGINIFVEEDDESYKMSDDAVIFNPQKVSVINGAQTLTNILLATEDLRNDLEDNELFDEQKIDEIIDKVLSEILVKTVFIKGSEYFSKPITWGLNNQIPIEKAEMLANNTEVSELNKILIKEQIGILKTGEMGEGFNTGLSPLQFVKLYLILKERPGTSKNFNKQKIDEEIKKSLIDFKKYDYMVRELSIVIDIDKWWFSSKISKKDTPFSKYGKNYFQSYVIHKLSNEKNKIDNFMIDDLELYFDNITKIINSLVSKDKELEVEANSFKSDQLFEKIKTENDYLQKNNQDFDEEKLVQYINENKKSNYSISNTIKNYYQTLEIKEENFRVITITGKSYRVKESFPLPNSTFEEFYKHDGYPDSSKYPDFANSKFREALIQKYNMYIIQLEDSDENYIVKRIWKKTEISFDMLENWEKLAEKTFDQTKEAFIKGETALFPKISSNLLFHIRPKAANSNDTFQFSDGSDITKRTFWVNSSSIETILESLDLFNADSSETRTN